jgi:hypothetical protein
VGLRVTSSISDGGAENGAGVLISESLYFRCQRPARPVYSVEKRAFCISPHKEKNSMDYGVMQAGGYDNSFRDFPSKF